MFQETKMKELSVTQNDAKKTTMKSWRRVAWILMLLADVGLLASRRSICLDQILSQSLAPNMRASPGTPGRNSLPQPRKLPIF